MENFKQAAGEWLKKNANVTAMAALVIAVGGVLLDFKKEEKFQYQDMLNEFRLEVTRLRDEVAICNTKSVDDSRKIASLENKLILLEGATLDNPLPMWLKSVGTAENPGVMLVVNESFEEMFLRPYGKQAHDYIGKTDAQYWGPKAGNEYWSSDLKVIHTGKIVDTYVTSPLGGRIRVIKFPRRFNRRIVGIVGVAIPSDSLTE